MVNEVLNDDTQQPLVISTECNYIPLSGSLTFTFLERTFNIKLFIFEFD